MAREPSFNFGANAKPRKPKAGGKGRKGTAKKGGKFGAYTGGK
jgi:hypothetical protein